MTSGVNFTSLSNPLVQQIGLRAGPRAALNLGLVNKALRDVILNKKEFWLQLAKDFQGRKIEIDPNNTLGDIKKQLTLNIPFIMWDFVSNCLLNYIQSEGGQVGHWFRSTGLEEAPTRESINSFNSSMLFLNNYRTHLLGQIKLRGEVEILQDLNYNLFPITLSDLRSIPPFENDRFLEIYLRNKHLLNVLNEEWNKLDFFCFLDLFKFTPKNAQVTGVAQTSLAKRIKKEEVMEKIVMILKAMKVTFTPDQLVNFRFRDMVLPEESFALLCQCSTEPVAVKELYLKYIESNAKYEKELKITADAALEQTLKACRPFTPTPEVENPEPSSSAAASFSFNTDPSFSTTDSFSFNFDQFNFGNFNNTAGGGSSFASNFSFGENPFSSSETTSDKKDNK